MADAILLVSAFVAQAVLNAVAWWKWGRDLKAHNVHLAWQVARLVHENAGIAGERDAARRAFEAAERENESLRARNDMLSGLVGGDRP